MRKYGICCIYYHWEMTNRLKYQQQIGVLPMNITDNVEWRLQIKKCVLLFENSNDLVHHGEQFTICVVNNWPVFLWLTCNVQMASNKHSQLFLAHFNCKENDFLQHNNKLKSITVFFVLFNWEIRISRLF